MLYEFVKNIAKQSSQKLYVMIDEVQILEDFVDVLTPLDV